jgi:hypothetical protein
MFSGTLRENVDPLRLFSDELIVDALQQAGLGCKTLNDEVGTSGLGWSLGEKQLVSTLPLVVLQHCRHSRAVDPPQVCLARVLLKKPAVQLYRQLQRLLGMTRDCRCCYSMKPRLLWMRRPKRCSSACSRRNSLTPRYFASLTVSRRCDGVEPAWK